MKTPMGHGSARFTDAVGRLLAVTDALGAQSRFEYNAHDQITTIIDPKGGETTFTLLWLAGPHPRSLARGDSAPRAGRRRSTATATCSR